jgi:hypothetical protein
VAQPAKLDFIYTNGVSVAFVYANREDQAGVRVRVDSSRLRKNASAGAILGN